MPEINPVPESDQPEAEATETAQEETEVEGHTSGAVLDLQRLSGNDTSALIAFSCSSCAGASC